jgi:hypothetical protein
MMSADIADEDIGLVLRNWKRTIIFLSSVGRICKKPLPIRLVILAHSEVLRRSSFYNLPSVRKATALVTAHSAFRVSEAY